MDAANTALVQEAAKMVGMVTALSIALQVAVRANPRADELHECVDGIREGARADLGKFHGQPGFDGIETVIGDFERMLRGVNGLGGARAQAIDVPQDPIVAIGRLVGTVTALQVALKVTVETNPRAARLRERLADVREAAIGHVIGEDVEDDVFEGIDYAMDDLDEMLPPAAAR